MSPFLPGSILDGADVRRRPPTARIARVRRDNYFGQKWSGIRHVLPPMANTFERNDIVDAFFSELSSLMQLRERRTPAKRLALSHIAWGGKSARTQQA